MDTTKENLKRLHKLHLRRYGGRLRAARTGLSGYMVLELHKLLALWAEVADKDFDYQQLSTSARIEVDDAIADEME